MQMLLLIEGLWSLPWMKPSEEVKKISAALWLDYESRAVIVLFLQLSFPFLYFQSKSENPHRVSPQGVVSLLLSDTENKQTLWNPLKEKVRAGEIDPEQWCHIFKLHAFHISWFSFKQARHKRDTPNYFSNVHCSLIRARESGRWWRSEVASDFCEDQFEFSGFALSIHSSVDQFSLASPRALRLCCVNYLRGGCDFEKLPFT